MRQCFLALVAVLCAALLGPAGRVAPAAGQALPIPVAPSHVGPANSPPAVPAVPAPAAVPQAGAPSALPVPPAQAQQVLDLLRDDRRRAEFAATLEALLKAAPAVPGAQPGAAAAPAVGAAASLTPAPAPVPAAAPASTPAGTPAGTPAIAKVIPLAPDSLGAEVLERASASLSDAGTQLVAAVRSMNDLPLLWRWVATQAADPIARDRVLDTAWKLAAVVLAGLLAEWAAARLLRRLRTTLGSWSPGHAEAEAEADATAGPPESGLAAAEAGETERAERRHRLTRTLGTLQRLPYLLGRLLLDLVPIGAFAATAGLLRGTWLGEPATTGLVIRAVMLAYVLCRVVLAVTGFLVSPATPRLRLLNVTDNAAGFLTRWTRRIAVTAIATYAVTEVAVMFGLYNTAREALLKLFALVVHGLLVVAVLQAQAPVAARIRSIRVGGVWSVLLRRLADVWHLVAVFYIVALWLVWAVELRGGYTRLVSTFLVTCMVMIASRLLAIVMLGGLDRALRPSAAMAARHPGLEARAGAYYPMLRVAAMAVLWAATGLALLQAWGFSPLTWFSKGDLGSRILSAGVLIAAVTLAAILVWEGTNAGIERHLAQLTADAQLARAGRLRTLMPMLRTTLLVVIVLVVGLIVLSEIGVNIAPLLAGAGVVGIAVGFGSQKLVQDLITGLFLLLENAMQVGDVVTLGGLTGTVEALSIRTIRLRALDGAVHIIPFSAVTTVTNQTRDYGYAVLDIGVGLNEEPGPVIEVVRDLAAAMRAEPKWAPLILDALDVMGVEKFVDLAWVLRVRLKTQPASRWSVGRELNRRVKERFDELAIESPVTSHRALSTNPPPQPTAGQPVEQAA
jgi:small-conductance mechanosensitive channel